MAALEESLGQSWTHAQCVDSSHLQLRLAGTNVAPCVCSQPQSSASCMPLRCQKARQHSHLKQMQFTSLALPITLTNTMIALNKDASKIALVRVTG